ncbi:hypothetical protein CU877_17865 [Salmonella enterica]|nr:hypothetical protein [Salmonella enterica]
MNDKKERYISSELSDKTQLSVLRSIVGWGYEKIRHSLGRPGQLERAIASGELIPCPLRGLRANGTKTYAKKLIHCLN